MRTLLNNSDSDFRANGAIHKSVVWRNEPPIHRVNAIGQARAAASFRSSSPEPEALELPDDDFPFSALIRLVRQMRQ